MPRKQSLSLMRIGECFVVEKEADEPRGLVGSIVKPDQAYRIDRIESGEVIAVSGTGEESVFPAASEVSVIPRGGYERLVTLHRQALEDESES